MVIIIGNVDREQGMVWEMMRRGRVINQIKHQCKPIYQYHHFIIWIVNLYTINKIHTCEIANNLPYQNHSPPKTHSDFHSHLSSIIVTAVNEYDIEYTQTFLQYNHHYALFLHLLHDFQLSKYFCGWLIRLLIHYDDSKYE